VVATTVELMTTRLRPAALAAYSAVSAAAISSSPVVPSRGKVATPNDAVTAICRPPNAMRASSIALRSCSGPLDRGGDGHAGQDEEKLLAAGARARSSIPQIG